MGNALGRRTDRAWWRRVLAMVVPGAFVFSVAILSAGLVAYGRDGRGWADRPSWLPLTFAPNDQLTLLALLVSGLGVVVSGPSVFPWWRRHLPFINVGLAAGVGMMLAIASYWNVSDGQAPWVTPVVWALMLFVNNPETPWEGPSPLAYQAARMVAIGVGVSVAARAISAVLWPRVARGRARRAANVVLVQGEGELAQRVALALADRSRPQRQRVVAIVADRTSAHAGRLRDRGADVLQGAIAEDDASRRMLIEIISTPRWYRLLHWRSPRRDLALDAAYLLGDDDAVNERAEEILESGVRDILARRRGLAHTVPPRIITRIDDDYVAQEFLRRRRQGPVRSFVSTIGLPQQTARGVVEVVLGPDPDLWPERILVEGDNDYTQAFLDEMALHLSVHQLIRDRRLALHAGQLASWLKSGKHWPGPELTPLRAPRILLPTQTSDSVVAAHRSTRARELAHETVDDVALTAAQPDVAVVYTSTSMPSSARQLERIALGRGADAEPMVCLTESAEGFDARPTIGNLVWYSPTLGGRTDTNVECLRGVPEDTWLRAARLLDSLYQVANGDSISWASSTDEAQASNLRALWETISFVNDKPAWHWAPSSASDPDASHHLTVELWDPRVDTPEPLPSDDEEQLLRQQHDSWAQFKHAQGYRGFKTFPWTRHNRLIGPWPAWQTMPATGWGVIDEVSADLLRRSSTRNTVHDTLEVLSRLGFVIAPTQEAENWLRVERRGLVRAERLTEDTPWRNAAGESLTGRRGDWKIWNRDPNTFWTATPEDFERGYEPYRSPTGEVESGAYRRVGQPKARRARVGEVARTKEGPTIAGHGMWRVHWARDNEWLVDRDTFAESYRVIGPADTLDAMPPSGPVAAIKNDSADAVRGRGRMSHLLERLCPSRNNDAERQGRR